MEVIKSKKEWEGILYDFKISDIFFKYAYFELYKKHYNVDIEGIYWEDKNIKIFLGHLVRDISNIPLYKNFNYFDLITPYGYGGPLIVTKTNDEDEIKKSLLKFKQEYYNYCISEKYVCEFIRFHPIFGNHKYFNYIFNVEYITDTVVADLNRDIDTIFKSLRKGQRYNINKTIKEGCTISLTSNPKEEDIDDFMECYVEMLKRNKSQKKYYFTKEFIKDHFNYLDSILITAKYNNNCIGASIFIKGSNIMYYHLSGSFKIKGIYPNDLIIWEAIKYAKQNNFKYLFLGGGRGSNDSLFKFKAGFSSEFKPFYVGKIIFDEDIYKKLVNIAKLDNNDNFFPLYRKIVDDTIV